MPLAFGSENCRYRSDVALADEEAGLSCEFTNRIAASVRSLKAKQERHWTAKAISVALP
jgi:hypothetical protein